jgi:hypothetical protein
MYGFDKYEVVTYYTRLLGALSGIFAVVVVVVCIIDFSTGGDSLVHITTPRTY